jgi:NADH:ubiquinone oxidoreductase subunit 6 (subunit J)
MSQAVARPVVRWRLGARSRKSVLLVHIASAGAWLGVDVVMVVLVFTALLSDDDRTKALSFRALELVAVGPLLALGLLCLLTGLVLVSLAPEVADAAERARQFDAGVPAPLGVGDLIFPPIVSPTALLVAMVLAVFKPWGFIRRQPTARER